MMDPQNDVWINILQSLGTTIVTVAISCFTAWKALKYLIDEWIKSQVKTSTDFVDTRISLKLKEEIEEQKVENKTLRSKIESIEHDYKLINEERIREMKEFFKEYK